MGWKVLTNLSVGWFWRIENNPIGPHKWRTHGRNLQGDSVTLVIPHVSTKRNLVWFADEWSRHDGWKTLFNSYSPPETHVGFGTSNIGFRSCYSEILWPKHRFFQRIIWLSSRLHGYSVLIPTKHTSKASGSRITLKLSPRDVNLSGKDSRLPRCPKKSRHWRPLEPKKPHVLQGFCQASVLDWKPPMFQWNASILRFNVQTVTVLVPRTVKETHYFYHWIPQWLLMSFSKTWKYVRKDSKDLSLFGKANGWKSNPRPNGKYTYTITIIYTW